MIWSERSATLGITLYASRTFPGPAARSPDHVHRLVNAGRTLNAAISRHADTARTTSDAVASLRCRRDQREAVDLDALNQLDGLNFLGGYPCA
jgi:hypothetical protein